MPRTSYELLGRIVWKGGLWYVKRRYLPSSGRGRFAKRLGAGALVAAALGGAVVIAQRRGNHAG